MKNHFFAFLLMIPLFVNAQDSQVDDVAVQILDHMSDVIGELTSCSYNLSSSQDIMDPNHGMIKQYIESEVVMSGPDKMLVNARGDNGHRGFWYNGLTATYYSFDENNYAIIDAPDNIISMIDSIHMNYDLEIPAADFFYPSFTDDILDSFDLVKFIGVTSIGDEPCFHLKTANETMEVQYWISDDAYNLPKKYLIIYKDRENMQYEGTFTNWNINPDIPESVYQFTPPPKAKKIKILAQN